MYYAALDSALSIGNAILDAGGEGPEAVMAVVNYFENNPLFNAGKGATCTSTGTFELDASIMEGKDLTAGAVAGLKTVKNPINAAYAVKNKTPHVMLAGEGADRFAKSQGLEIVDNMYFATPKTLKWIEDLKKESKKNGTVGCVVLDKQGNLTAGTSTGGMFKKQWGRVGDSPVIGAGTYADNEGCAVSCTGHGEYFIRHVVAYNLSTRVKLLHQPVGEAADYIIHQELNTKEGNGGLIAVDKKGNFAIATYQVQLLQFRNSANLPKWKPFRASETSTPADIRWLAGQTNLFEEDYELSLDIVCREIPSCRKPG